MHKSTTNKPGAKPATSEASTKMPSAWISRLQLPKSVANMLMVLSGDQISSQLYESARSDLTNGAQGLTDMEGALQARLSALLGRSNHPGANADAAQNTRAVFVSRLLAWGYAHSPLTALRDTIHWLTLVNETVFDAAVVANDVSAVWREMQAMENDISRLTGDVAADIKQTAKIASQLSGKAGG